MLSPGLVGHAGIPVVSCVVGKDGGGERVNQVVVNDWIGMQNWIRRARHGVRTAWLVSYGGTMGAGVLTIFPRHC